MNRYSWGLMLVAISWGLTFPALKVVSASLNGLEITALRFSICSIFIIPFLLKASKQSWRDGFILAIVGVLSYTTQAYGINYISPSRSAVISNFSIVFSPMLLLFMRKSPKIRSWLASCMALFGIFLLSWSGGSDLRGDSLTLLTAVFYTTWVFLLSRYAARNSTISLAAIQLVCVAGLSWFAIALTQHGFMESFHKVSYLSNVAWMSLIYLGLIVSGCMTFIQTWAQKRIESTKAALIYGTEPVFACLFSWLWLGESLSYIAIFGLFIVAASIAMGT
jgi:drug/metabolite transporter (DMT)-like permease